MQVELASNPGRSPNAGAEHTLSALWEREMWTGIYQPRWVELQTDEGPVDAIAFVVDAGHPQFAGDLPPAEQAERIAAASGAFGSCHEYLAQTVRSLAEHGCPDDDLTALLGMTAPPTP